MIYIQKQLGIYQVQESLSSNFETGTTYQDLVDGKFILLDPDQEAFAESNPRASVCEIFLRQIFPIPTETLPVRKILKVAEIEQYDKSANVNSFIINGVSMWLDRSTRTSLMITIAAYKAYTLQEITLWTEGSNPVPITVSLTELESLLIALEMYAKACFDTTASHKANVQQLTTIHEVDEYNFLEGYPEKLNININ